MATVQELRLVGFFAGETKQGGTRDLHVLRLADHALAFSPHFNGAYHRVEHMSQQGFILLLQPDGWFPVGNRIQKLEVSLTDAQFSVVVEGEQRAGAVVTETRTHAADQLPQQGLIRLTALAPKQRDEPRFDIELHIDGGQIAASFMGPCFHKAAAKLYPFIRYTATIDQLSGQVRGEVSQASLGDDGSLTDSCDFDLQWYAVDDKVVGSARWTCKGVAIEAAVHGALLPLADQKPPVGIWRHQQDTRPWFKEDESWRPVAANEHPRLLLRSDEITVLRERAATATGQSILARLRHVMGGDELPTLFNDYPVVGQNAKGNDLPVGTFTNWHSQGFALLYVVTGDRRYADRALACVRKAIEGIPNRDERYCWKKAGGLRIGPVLEGAVFAYDWCYDAWTEEERSEVRHALLDYADESSGKTRDLEFLLERNGFPPGSNHYGAYIGGPGLVALCFRGDDDVDAGRIASLLDATHRGIIRNLQFGFGDYGAFAEGHHPARLSANSAFLPLLQAMKTALGRDYISTRPEVQNITLRWIHEITEVAGAPRFQHRGVYGTDDFDSGGISHGGEFAHGFGVVPARFHGALLWTFNELVAVKENDFKEDRWLPPGENSFNVVMYPHRALYAMVNWPLDVQPKNPGEVLPSSVVDKVHGYFMWRQRWQDADDCIVSLALSTGPGGYYTFNKGTPALRLWGAGLHGHIPLRVAKGAIVTAYEERDDIICISWAEIISHQVLSNHVALIPTQAGVAVCVAHAEADPAEDAWDSDLTVVRTNLAGKSSAAAALGDAVGLLSATEDGFMVGDRRLTLTGSGWAVAS